MRAECVTADRPAPPLVPLLDPQQSVEYAVWVALWLFAAVDFWLWWLEPEHNIGTIRYVLMSGVLAWVTLLPLYFIVIFAFSRVPNKKLPPPPGCKVAMVVTKAPSEPFAVVRETLEAMLKQRFPNDVWLADEDPSEETLRWCERYGVRVSTRKGEPDYHRSTWPRRTRCKEGNLAYFYDKYGYDNYDFVCQLDADHIPNKDYLEEMLRPFNDPSVGYVSAPSICDKNADASWSARGRLYVEGTLHGALQAGYSGGLAPLCIGSHYAVRTAALKQIGGLGPELAEDHSTTLLMNAGGWRGVHAIDAIAHGDGPAAFADLALQEFQWSRSLMTILVQYTPKYLARLPLRLKLQFLFCQFWYPLFAGFMLIMYLTPIAALFSDSNMVGVTYPEFAVRFFGPSVVLVAMAFWWRRHDWSRPREARVLSWEGTLFLFARWPWALLGIVMAIIDTIKSTPAGFRVTPKGGQASDLPTRVLIPYALLAITAASPLLALPRVMQATGFYFFAALNCVIYTALILVIIVQHNRENPRPSGGRHGAGMFARSALAGFVLAVTAIAVPLHAPQGIGALAIGFERISRQLNHAFKEPPIGTFLGRDGR
jgi:cellulose synthase (UDP-forming)